MRPGYLRCPYQRVGRDRHVEAEGTALVTRLLQLQRAAHGFGEAPRQREAEPRTLGGIIGVEACEGSEELVMPFVGNAAPMIPDADTDTCRLPASGDAYLTADAVVLDRVGQKVEQYL